MAAHSDRPPAEDIILYEKDPATKIATITINRPDKHNAITIAARHRFADIIHRANVDDEVKVLVIRGIGDNFGTGDDLPEMADLFSERDIPWLHDFRIGEDEGVKYPPKGSYRHLAAVTHLYARSGEGMRDLQDFKKISIVEAKGYCYGWHFYLAADADIVIASDDALFGHAAFRYAGWAARMWQWALTMGLRPFMEMVFTGRPFTAAEMKACSFVNAVVPRAELEATTMKYALACARNRPTDTVVMQKTFFEVFKQHQGEYMGSILSAWLESMLPAVLDDSAIKVDADLFDKGLSKAVKDNDSNFPPEWRLSHAG
ncbi:MAG: enoyl-CoA hydratase/isomerase family protein, partial [Novosphingobium sp.]|nr:enoyl-CoA hydratase/isomerase family protein [Novosphingobium sp.]